WLGLDVSIYLFGERVNAGFVVITIRLDDIPGTFFRVAGGEGIGMSDFLTIDVEDLAPFVPALLGLMKKNIHEFLIETSLVQFPLKISHVTLVAIISAEVVKDFSKDIQNRVKIIVTNDCSFLVDIEE